MNNLDNGNGKMSAEGTSTKAYGEEEQRKEYGDGGIIVNREFHVRDDVV